MADGSVSTRAAPEGNIDLGGDHLRTDEVCLIRGWVALGCEALARVEISVDGRAVGRARPAQSRPDVAKARASADAGLCGFEFWLDPAEIPAGAERIKLSARAVGIHGTAVELTKSAALDRAGTPSADVPQRHQPEHCDEDLPVLRQRVQDVISASAHRPTYPLRPLIFSHHLGYGGAQLFMTEILSMLRVQTGLECAVVSLEDGPLREVLESMDIAVQIIQPDPIQSPVAYEDALLELAAWAAPQGFNAVMVNTLGPFFGVDLAERLGIPAVWFVHESLDPAVWWWHAHGAPRSYAWRRMQRAMRNAEALVFPAEGTRRLFLDYADEDRLITAPIGLMLDEIDRYIERVDRRQLRQRLDIAEQATVILCLGTIEPRKGQTALAVAFRELAERFPDAVLVLVGETDQRPLAHIGHELRRFTVRAGLQSRITVLPLTPDPYQWLAVADVFVMPSDIESLPRVVLEAMAFEVPVVATSIFGLTDLIEDGRTGYLCEAGDVGALRDALERVLASGPEGRRAVARAAAERVRREHNARDYSRWIARWLAGLIASHRPPARE